MILHHFSNDLFEFELVVVLVRAVLLVYLFALLVEKVNLHVTHSDENDVDG